MIVNVEPRANDTSPPTAEMSERRAPITRSARELINACGTTLTTLRKTCEASLAESSTKREKGEVSAR